VRARTKETTPTRAELAEDSRGSAPSKSDATKNVSSNPAGVSAEPQSRVGAAQRASASETSALVLSVTSVLSNKVRRPGLHAEPVGAC
jgi:hypothetical protein